MLQIWEFAKKNLQFAVGVMVTLIVLWVAYSFGWIGLSSGKAGVWILFAPELEQVYDADELKNLLDVEVNCPTNECPDPLTPQALSGVESRLNDILASIDDMNLQCPECPDLVCKACPDPEETIQYRSISDELSKARRVVAELEGKPIQCESACSDPLWSWGYTGGEFEVEHCVENAARHLRKQKMDPYTSGSTVYGSGKGWLLLVGCSSTYIFSIVTDASNNWRTSDQRSRVRMELHEAASEQPKK